MNKETYILNGRKFSTYDDAVKYASEINCRITKTVTVRKNVYILEVTSL